MEIRLLKISEFDKLIDAIRQLWNPNHVYCRNPELLKYLVYNTPYRENFCGSNENTSFFIIVDANKIVGLHGFIPLEGNILGKSVPASTATILKIDKQNYKFIGIDLLHETFKSNPYIHLGVGINSRVKRLYKALGWYTFDDFPRWIWTENYNNLQKLFNIPEYSNLNILNNKFEKKVSTDVELVDDLEEDKWNDFYNKVFAPQTVGVKRDYKFLKWRYIDYPFFDYKLLVIKDRLGQYKGLAVYRIENILDGQYRLGRILEFIYDDIDYGIKLAAKLQTIANDILFWDFYCLSSITALALERCGFIRLDSNESKKYIPTRFQPIDYEIMNIQGTIRLNDAAKKLVNLVTDQQWYVTKGDADQDRPN